MGLSGVRRSPGIPGETKCEGDGVGRYDESWPAEVTHLTQWPDLNLQLLYIKEILEKEVKPLTSRRQVTGGPMERKLFSSKKALTFV